MSTLLLILTYVACAGLLFYDGLVHMVGGWGSEDYSYCYLVPLVILYMVWEKRESFGHRPRRRGYGGFLPLLAGIGFFWLGELGGEYLTLYLGAWLVLLALVWIYHGWPRLKVILFPLLMIPAMFPLPSFLHNRLSLKLKLLSSQIGVEMMQLFGMTAYREGNIIDLGFTQLQVVDACSGLRYLFPIIILGLLLAWFFRAPFWKKAVLVLSTLPLIVLTNSVRIALTGILYEPFGAKVAEGFFHDFSGWLIFMVTLAILLVEIALLRRLPGKVAAVAGRGGSGRESGGTPPRLSPNGALLAAVLLLAVSFGVSRGVEFREKIPATRPLAEFPLSLDGWHGVHQEMEDRFVEALDLSDYFIIDYVNDQGESVNFYTAYYESQRKGESIHSPASCLSGSGWVFKGAGERALSIAGYGGITVNRAFMLKNDHRQLVYYWFPQRGRNLTNAYQLKIYVFWDALTQQRTDGALVRLITPVRDFEEVEAADSRLQGFMAGALPQLAKFLPGARLER